MSTYSTGGFAAAHEAVIRGFGLSPSDLAETADGAGANPTERLRRALARSTRGVESTRRYWATAPEFQLGSALDPFGYDLTLEASEGGEIDPSGTFEVVLEGDGVTRRTRFRYPDEGHGEDDYPALVGAVQTRLLPRELSFVRLADDGDHWRFFLARSGDVADLRERFGRRIELDGRPLLADRQPQDAADPAGPAADGGGSVEGLDPAAADGIEDAFESVERAAVTGQVRPGDGAEEVELADVVPEFDGEDAVVRDLAGDRLEDVVDGLESDPGAIETDPGPSPDPGPSRWQPVPDGEDADEDDPVEPDRTGTDPPEPDRTGSDAGAGSDPVEGSVDPDRSGSVRLSEKVASVLSAGRDREGPGQADPGDGRDPDHPSGGGDDPEDTPGDRSSDDDRSTNVGDDSADDEGSERSAVERLSDTVDRLL